MISGSFIDKIKEVSENLSKLIVCLTGMPGAGKSTIANGLKSKGYEIINMGDAVREEAKKRNIEPSGQNLGKLMLELREKNGLGAVAELIQNKIKNSSSNVIVIDGIRSNEEIQVLRKFGTVKILSVHASTDTRYSFLIERGRSDDPQTRDNFDERDVREIKVGISTPIALADESISNNELTVDELIDRAYKIIQGWQK
jgi:dephospho-CoA kinase